MFLLEQLQTQLEASQSMFARQLLHEDIERLEKLIKILKTTSTKQEFTKAGMVVGWTKGDLRTFELKQELSDFLSLFYDFQSTPKSQTPKKQKDLLLAWQMLNAKRMKVLLHCL